MIIIKLSQLKKTLPKSDKHDRFRLDMLGQMERLTYKGLLEVASKEVGRLIRDIIELSGEEITRVQMRVSKMEYDEIKEIRERIENGTVSDL